MIRSPLTWLAVALSVSACDKESVFGKCIVVDVPETCTPTANVEIDLDRRSVEPLHGCVSPGDTVNIDISPGGVQTGRVVVLPKNPTREKPMWIFGENSGAGPRNTISLTAPDFDAAPGVEADDVQAREFEYLVVVGTDSYDFCIDPRMTVRR